MKQRGAVGKWLFKKSMEPYLPRNVIYRPKVGFGGPVRYWLKNQLRPLLEDTLNPSTLAQDSFFDPRAVQKLIADDRMGRIDASYIILSLLCFHLWYRTYGAPSISPASR
jgi:asparagine synthase (glutamine-hydrolysing)